MKKINYLTISLVLLVSVFFGCGGSNEAATENENISSGVSYQVDENGCLIDENSDDSILYSNAENQAITVLWNQEDYQEETNKRVEMLFTSENNGDCFLYDSEYVTDAPQAIEEMPEIPIYAVTITDLQVNYSLSDMGQPGYDWSVTVANAGNVTLMGAIIERYTFLPGNDQTYGFAGSMKIESVPVDGLETFSGSIHTDDFPSGTYEYKINIIMWDGTLIGSETIFYTIP